MNDQILAKKLPPALLILRLGVAVVFIMWTVDKFLNPEHTVRIYEKYYMISNLDPNYSYIIGAVQLVILIAFIGGALKAYSYMAMFILHFISTASTIGKMLDPWTVPHLLFFTAIPMLAAIWVLWSLRDYDTKFSWDARTKGNPDN